MQCLSDGAAEVRQYSVGVKPGLGACPPIQCKRTGDGLRLVSRQILLGCFTSMMLPLQTARMRAGSRALLLMLALGVAPKLFSQREVPLPQQNEYGAMFFDQLRRIFGQFRDADLQRVFQMARPTQCSELVTDKGEWREVAFFNENRKLGDWHRSSLDEVKNDLAVYIFKGVCRGQRGPVQVITKFPVDESIRAYQERRINFREIEVNENAPVTAAVDSQTEAYTFDLPYLFRTTDKNGDRVYTLNPARLSDRYASDVINRWECKSVIADDVTYQFLICHTTLVPRDAVSGNRGRNASFGASAYSILSDGKEASSTVRLTFGDQPVSTGEPGGTPSSPSASTLHQRPTEERTWRPVAPQARLIDIGQREFRLRFNAEMWKGRVDRPQFIADGILANGGAAPPRNKDYCTWRPGARGGANQLLDTSNSDTVLHSLEFRKEARSATSTVFQMESDAGLALGVLQCFFPKTQTPEEITVGMWLSTVGSNIGLEKPEQ